MGDHAIQWRFTRVQLSANVTESKERFTTSIPPAWLMRTGLCSCLGVHSKALSQWLTSVWSLCHMNKGMHPPHLGLPLPRGQSLAHITIGLAGLVICDLSPTMSCQWASVSSGLWCSSHLVPILCPLSRAVLPGQTSPATFASAPFAIHKLWAMSSILCLIALI